MAGVDIRYRGRRDDAKSKGSIASGGADRKPNAAADGGRTILLFTTLAILFVCAFVVLVQMGFYLGLALKEWLDRKPYVHPDCYGVHRPNSKVQCPVRALPPNFSRCRPNYYIAGAAKGGTTSLHTYLTKHPKVYPYRIRGGPRDGESFTRLQKTYHRYEFSRHQWDDLEEDQIIGDSTVTRLIGDAYSTFGRYACDDSKIFLLLRDPIERCYSYHLMNHRLGVTKETGLVDDDDDEEENEPLESVAEVMRKELEEFREIVKRHPEIVTDLWDEEESAFGSNIKNCLHEGAYVYHLRRLFRTDGGVSQDRVRIYWSEEFFANPRAVVRDAMAFVGVDPEVVDLEKITSEKYNTQAHISSKGRPEAQQGSPMDDPDVAFPQSLRDEMERAIRPFNEQLAKFLGEEPPWMTKEKKQNSL